VYVSRKALVSMLVGVLATASLVFALAASGKPADHGDGKGKGKSLFRSTLAPSVPADPKFHNVAAGGLPWQLDSGSVRIKRNGQLDLRVRGLVIPASAAPQFNGTPGPVTTVSASLFCGADTVTTPAASTAAVPISRAGDARIEAHLSLPASCLAPIVLVNPNGSTGAYIAVTGWKS
jgi:hypothetical protein